MNIDAIRPKIFSARKIVTMTNNVEPEAFATLGERIVATGSATDLSTRFKDATRIDFSGATIVPGFNDSHMHLAMTAEDLLRWTRSLRQRSGISKGQILPRVRVNDATSSALHANRGQQSCTCTARDTGPLDVRHLA